MQTQVALNGAGAALLCIDLQEEHRRDERLLTVGYDLVLANVQSLQAAARRSDVPVFHLAYIVDVASATTRPFHPRTEDGRSAFSDKDDPNSSICPEVAPVGGEALFIKTEASGFGDGTLLPVLRDRGIDWLIVCGVWTEACIDATVKDALKHGFRVLLVKDACGSGSVAMHQTGILNLANRLYGGAVVSTDAACRLIAGHSASGWSPRSPVPIRFTFETAEALYAAL